MEALGLNAVDWRKSSRSGSNAQCVGVADFLPGVAVWDSKLSAAGDFPVLTVDRVGWSNPVADIRAERL